MSGTISDPTDPNYSPQNEPSQQPGFLGISPDTWSRLAYLGGSMSQAANARTAGGFLANGPGFAGPLGAAVVAGQQNDTQLRSQLAYQQQQTQGLNLQNQMNALQLPYARQLMALRQQLMNNPQFMASIGMGGAAPTGLAGSPLGTPAATGNAGAAGSNVATGDTPQGGSPFYQGIAQLESGGGATTTNPLAKPAVLGGPAGPAQFKGGTWGQFAAENPQYFVGKSPDQIQQMRSDPQLSATATDWLAAKNAATLKAAGIDATPQNLGIAHAFGGAGAAGILKFPDEASLSQVLQVTQPGAVNDILKENPQYARMTVGDLRNKYSKLGPPSWMMAQGQGQSQQPAPYRVAQAGNGPIPTPGGGAPQSGGGNGPLPVQGGAPQQPPTSGVGQGTGLPSVPWQQWMAQADAADQQANNADFAKSVGLPSQVDSAALRQKRLSHSGKRR